MSLNGACLGMFDKNSAVKKMSEIWGFKGEFSEMQITSHV